MITGDGEARIGVAPEVVFDFVADARNEPHWLPGAVEVFKTSDGPIGLHTQFEGKYARAGTVSLELVEFEPPHRLTFRAHSKIVDFDDTVEFVADGDGTLLTARLAAKPRGVMRLFTPMMAKTMQRQFAANWTYLEEALKQG